MQIYIGGQQLSIGFRSQEFGLDEALGPSARLYHAQKVCKYIVRKINIDCLICQKSGFARSGRAEEYCVLVWVKNAESSIFGAFHPPF